MTEAIQDNRQIVVEISGQQYEIKPLKTAQVPDIMELAESFIDKFSGVDNLEAELAKIVITHSRDLIKAVTVASRIPKNVIDELDLDEFLELTMAVVEVNLDFFVNRLLPALQAMPERAQKIGAIFGSLQSSD